MVGVILRAPIGRTKKRRISWLPNRYSAQSGNDNGNQTIVGFDPAYLTCYKCPFCAGVPTLESYFSSPLEKAYCCTGPARIPTRPSFITPFGLAVEACSERPHFRP